MGRSAVPISWARGRTLRGFRDPVKPERPFSRWPRPHCPERPAEVSSCASVAASEPALRRLRSPRVPDSPRPRDPASRLAPAGPLAPLIARCSRPSSSRTALEPARRTRPPAPIGPPRPRRRPVRLALLRFRCRGHLVQRPFRPPPPLPCTDRLGMPLRARSLPKSVHRRRCRHASARRCVRGPRVPPSARRPERSAPPTQGRDTGHRFPRCKSCRRFPCLHGLWSMSVPDRRES